MFWQQWMGGERILCMGDDRVWSCGMTKLYTINVGERFGERLRRVEY